MLYDFGRGFCLEIVVVLTVGLELGCGVAL
jgi:hypothetical protein